MIGIPRPSLLRGEKQRWTNASKGVCDGHLCVRYGTTCSWPSVFSSEKTDSYPIEEGVDCECCKVPNRVLCSRLLSFAL